MSVADTAFFIVATIFLLSLYLVRLEISWNVTFFLLFFFGFRLGNFLEYFLFFSRNTFFSFASKHVSSTSIVSCIHILDSVNILG